MNKITQTQCISLLMKPKWQLVAVLISSVHKPWLQNVCEKDGKTIYRADDQAIKAGFVFSFPLQETQMNIELLSFG